MLLEQRTGKFLQEVSAGGTKLTIKAQEAYVANNIPPFFCPCDCL